MTSIDDYLPTRVELIGPAYVLHNPSPRGTRHAQAVVEGSKLPATNGPAVGSRSIARVRGAAIVETVKKRKPMDRENLLKHISASLRMDVRSVLCLRGRYILLVRDGPPYVVEFGYKTDWASGTDLHLLYKREWGIRPHLLRRGEWGALKQAIYDAALCLPPLAVRKGRKDEAAVRGLVGPSQPQGERELVHALEEE